MSGLNNSAFSVNLLYDGFGEVNYLLVFDRENKASTIIMGRVCHDNHIELLHKTLHGRKSAQLLCSFYVPGHKVLKPEMGIFMADRNTSHLISL